MALAGTSATFPRKRLVQNFTLREIPAMGAAGCWPERRRAGLPWRRLQVGSVNQTVPREVELVGVPTNSSGTAAGWPGRRPCCVSTAYRPRWRAGRDSPMRGISRCLPRSPARASGLLAEDALITMIGRVARAVCAARGRGRFPIVPGLTWETEITSAALASEGCAGWSVCIYNPDLDPGRQGPDEDELWTMRGGRRRQSPSRSFWEGLGSWAVLSRSKIGFGR